MMAKKREFGRHAGQPSRRKNEFDPRRCANGKTIEVLASTAINLVVKLDLIFAIFWGSELNKGIRAAEGSCAPQFTARRIERDDNRNQPRIDLSSREFNQRRLVLLQANLEIVEST